MLQIMKHMFYSFILFGDDRFTLIERFISWFKLALAFAPIAYMLNAFHVWFADNRMFVTAFLLVTIINMALGGWKHIKTKEFSWEELIKKTLIMLLLVILTYYVLHALQVVAGDNDITTGFEILIQVTTIFYPSSKALKSIYVISNGEHPPKFIMEKLYNFEKDGNVKDLLDSGADNSKRNVLETELEEPGFSDEL